LKTRSAGLKAPIIKDYNRECRKTLKAVFSRPFGTHK
jgi:hypothetical protein